MNIVIDTHTHTIASGHAYNTINEMIKSAADKGLELLGITDHAPNMPGSCTPMNFLNFRALRREKYGVKLLFGAELNIIDTDGNIDLSGEALEALDIGIASMHPPCYKGGTAEQNLNAYINAMKNPHVNIIGHPDDGRYPVDMQKLVYAAKENHVLLELNNASLNPAGFRAKEGAENNDIEMLKYCVEYKQPVIIGSDAHIEEDVAEFGYALDLLKRVNFPEELIINTSVDKLLEYAPYNKIK